LDYNSVLMEEFKQEVKRLTGAELTDQQLKAFEHYYELLHEWNKRFNLTAFHSRGDIYRKLFLDSLSCMLALEGATKARLADVGSGGGFPGMPLKIVRPDMELTLIESNQKKARFLEAVVEELNLDGVEVAPRRVERIGQDWDYRERFDWAVSRAVAPLLVLLEYLLPLVRVGGFALAQKGAKAAGEVEASEKALEEFGGKVVEIKPVKIRGMEEERNLVVIEKVKQTPEKYPRRAGIPKKRPLA